MKSQFQVFTLLASMCLLPVPLVAGQAVDTSSGGPSTTFGTINVNSTFLKDWIVEGKVVTLQGDPVQGAKVEVQPITAAGEFRTLPTDLQGGFRTEYHLNLDTVKDFSVELTVTKKDFLKAHQFVDFGSSDRFWVIPVTLRAAIQDPNLLWQEDLISHLAPKLRGLATSDGLSAKSEKDYARGVQEFLDRHRPDRAVPFFSKVVKRDAACIKCRTMLGLAELDSGDWDGARRDIGEAARQTTADRKLASAEPWVAYGVMESWRHEPKSAAGSFVEALKLTPQDPLALQELGRSQLLLENWGSASEYLARATSAGAAPEARLMWVEALLGSGDFDGANKEMIRYLDGRQVKNMPLPVRKLWAQVENKKKVEATYAKVASPVKHPIDYLHGAIPDLQGIVPATDQALLDSILGAVGKNVAAYFRNFPNTISVEQIHEEKLRHNGKVGGSLDQKFNYLCLTPTEETGLGFTEYRANLLGDQGQPKGLNEGFMLTSGFASASLIFHPEYQPETTFRYLGRKKINGRDTFVIAFAQQPTKARLNGNFKLGENTMPTFSQGLAWVDAETYQIIRLRTDLLKPLPDLRLEKETTEIDFVAAQFKNIAEDFWLPREVTVSVDWDGKSLRNTHEYSDFKLFNVGATQKIGAPK